MWRNFSHLRLPADTKASGVGKASRKARAFEGQNFGKVDAARLPFPCCEGTPEARFLSATTNYVHGLTFPRSSLVWLSDAFKGSGQLLLPLPSFSLDSI